MNSTFTQKAPAKINIGLHVLSKRKDGYHNIETIYYPIKLYDQIAIKLTRINSNESKIILKTDSKLLRHEGSNLCAKAALYFLNEFFPESIFKIEIKLNKKIPIGAGLGGGSSDAAAVLKILADAFSLDSAEKKKVSKLALNLGSDVPYFLLAEPAYAESRGEKLKPLRRFNLNYDILIVNPAIHISTPDAYNKLNIKNEKPKTLYRINNFSLKHINKFNNDFEKVVFKEFPIVKSIKDEMNNFGAVFSSMSGSGSTVFGFFNNKNLNDAKKHFLSKGYFTFISKK